MLCWSTCILLIRLFWRRRVEWVRKNGGNVKNMRKKSGEPTLYPIEDFSWSDIFFNKEKLKEFIIKNMSKGERELLLMYEDRWYTNVYPVISKNYRPMPVTNILGVPNILSKDINIEYQVISLAIKDINETSDMIEDQLINKLIDITETMGRIVGLLYTELGDGKTSAWRSEVIAPRVDNSGRLVIESISDPTIDRIDVVQLPLDFFRVVFSSDVTKIAKQVLRLPVNQIDNITDMNYKLTQEERRIIREEIFPRVEAPYVYISREPCIYMNSVS